MFKSFVYYLSHEQIYYTIMYINHEIHIKS